MSTESKHLTFLVEGDNSILIDHVEIPPPLPVQDGRGYKVEDNVRHLAASNGLKDFVFQHQDTSHREIGDALVLHRDRALMVQVKARNAAKGSDAKETSWLKRSVEKALRQADGSIRRLDTASEIVNLRENRLTISNSEHRWLKVVIVDQPSNARHPESDPSCVQNFVVLTFSEWEFLCKRLASTGALVNYLFDRAQRGLAAYGEAISYFLRTAVLDSETPSQPLSSWAVEIGEPVSTPGVISKASPGAAFYRDALEIIARVSQGMPERSKLDLLMALDTCPVVHRPRMLDFIHEMDRSYRKNYAKTGCRWRILHSSSRSPTIITGYTNELSQQLFREMLQSRLALEHDLRQQSGDKPVETVGLLFTPRNRVEALDISAAYVPAESHFETDYIDNARRFWTDNKVALRP